MSSTRGVAGNDDPILGVLRGIAVAGNVSMFIKKTRRRSIRSMLERKKARTMKEEELQKKREEAERKARRGEIDPTHEFTFMMSGQLSGLMRHEIMDFIFKDPTMLDDLDVFYKSDNSRKILFYYQDEESKEEEKQQKRIKRSQRNITAMQKKEEVKVAAKKILFVTDGCESPLNGLCMYFLRTSTRRTLNEETFQREIMCGVVDASLNDNLLWITERIVSNVFIPLLNNDSIAEQGTNHLLHKVKKELLPCLRSFTSSLRVAELVWMEGVLIKDFPPEAFTIKCLDDSMALLKQEDGQKRFEEHLRQWMKKIQELLLESEQLRLETDDAGPQDELEYWKARAARLTLLVEQINTHPCKMTIVTLRAAQSKLLKPKPFRWMLDVIWLNLVELSKLETFNSLLDKVVATEREWKYWCDTESPEEEEIPCGYQANLDVFRKLLLIRCWCPDRTLSQARKYIFDSLGADFLENSVLDLEGMLEEVENKTPLICLLSTGSDPSIQIETLARSKGQEYRQLSMGQGQEDSARKMITDAVLNGHWLMLQNCHLSLEFCEEIMQSLVETDEMNVQFRLWVTTEVNKDFPIGLLQMSLKYTNEPPQGIRASLKRTYGDITQDTLDYSNHYTWPTMLYSIAFLHTVVQERRKYGPLGWNIPYEFNRADFSASTQFVMNHLDDLDPKRGISWQTVCFMLGEVQYGGRVTDDYDKRLLNTFTNVWFSENLINPGFKFYEGYPLPDCKTLEEYTDFITNMPLQDIPEVFGLHSNADITYQINTAKGILDTILNVQPKEGSGTKSSDTREAVVGRIAEDMLRKLPRDYVPHEVKEALVRLGGMLPMNIFLRQEIDRMQKILTLIRRSLSDLKMALEGTIIMSENLKDILDAMYDARVPENWKKISWQSTTLGFWYTELLERDGQFKRWCFHGRPKVFWMTGFFNPQGFLTAMRQEVTRAHKGWALDSVICQNLVTRFSKEDIHDSPPEGVYIHGLFLEGASLDRKTGKLVESRPKVLYEQMPVIYVYAINTTAGKDSKLYECPIYRKPARTDLNYIGSIDFESDIGPKHWTMRGVALLCDIK